MRFSHHGSPRARHQENGRKWFQPRLEEVEPRVLPASPVILLNNFANQGATLRGFEENAFAGSPVAGAGDVNGDGFADLMVGGAGADAGGVFRGGGYHLLCGAKPARPTPTPQTLRAGGV